MPFNTDGTLTTDKKTVNDTDGWDTQTEWEAYQSATNIQISTGVVKLSEVAVPAAGDLEARYDFSVEDGSLPVTDQTGNGNDLGGAYSGVSESINGVQAGDFDGVDDSVSVSFASAVSQPTTIAAVVRVNNITGSSDDFFDGSQSLESLIRVEGSTGEWGVYSGNGVSSGVSADLNPHIFVVRFNGSSTEIRIDGTLVKTGSAGSSTLSGVTIGSRGGGSNYAESAIGEVLVYPEDKSGIYGDIESYLSDKWGVTI